MTTLGAWGHWFLIDWHWLIVLLAIVLLLATGFIVVGEDDGDWFIF